MLQVDIVYNPYRIQTQITVNGINIDVCNRLYHAVRGKRLQEWIGNFPAMLTEEYHTKDISISFSGTDLDWDDLKEAFEHARDVHVIHNLEYKAFRLKSDVDVKERIVRVFEELRNGPLDDFRDERLLKAFENVNNSVFPIHVIATMSSGKSTLINALLQKKLMPAKNEACTATITKILDNGDDKFSAIAYDENGEPLKEIEELTYETMEELNQDKNVSDILVKGNIPFLDSENMALMLVDTPGPNSAQNQEHRNATYRAINNDSNNLVLYVLNATALGTVDDASLLKYVAEQMKKGGKQVRDRFLFVINKMDAFNIQEESIEKAIDSAKKYLSEYGIEEPQIFPCSAYTALYIRTFFKDINIENMSRMEEKKLPIDAKRALLMYEFFADDETGTTHLEKYTELPPSVQKKLEKKLENAVINEDISTQVLFYSGILSIEAAIATYVKKYAKTKKIKDLVETFQEVMESSQVLAKAKNNIVTDEKAAEECEQRAKIINVEIADGKEARAFKKKIQDLDPMQVIRDKAEKLKRKAARDTARTFDFYGSIIDSRKEAKLLVKQFTDMSSSALAELASELESVVNKEVVNAGEKILNDYQKKLSLIDEMSEDKHLDFGTIDLVKGSLTGMKETAQSWCSDNFAENTVQEAGDIVYDTKTYYVKVGQEKKKVLKESHWEKVGTKKVEVGEHKEKKGTRNIKNPKKKGVFGKLKFWEPEYIQEEVFGYVKDYVDQDVFKEVKTYETIITDKMEKRSEQVERYTVKTKDLQIRLVSVFRENLDCGVEDALNHAQKQISTMKQQFMDMFQELDCLIGKKYKELQNYAKDKRKKEKDLDKNKEIIQWIEECKKEIQSALEI